MSGRARFAKERDGRVWHVVLGRDQSLLFNCEQAFCGTIRFTDGCGAMPDGARLCKACERKLLELVALAVQAGLVAADREETT